MKTLTKNPLGIDLQFDDNPVIVDWDVEMIK